MIERVRPGRYCGKIRIPPSKSDAQRAILAAALHQGKTCLYNVGESNDEKAMLRNIVKLGAVLKTQKDGSVEVTGIKRFPEKCVLNAGESGLGVRLITSVCAAHEGEFKIHGEGSLLLRPQAFFEEHLTQMGVAVNSSKGFLPLGIKGRMRGGTLTIDGSVSSQFLSGMLMALPLIKEDTELIVKKLKSVPYVQMTLDTLRKFGVVVRQLNVEHFFISGGQTYQCEEYAIEGDWSSAGYWLVAGALGHEVEIEGLKMDSLQADRAMVEVLEKAGCRVQLNNRKLNVFGKKRSAFEFDATHCPDLFPALVTLAAFCSGTSRIKGVHRLKDKESNRGAALQSEFGKLGLEICVENDALVVKGGGELRSAQVDAHNDHRIAMCLAIAGTMIPGGVEINGAESVAKSYPTFWKHLNALCRDNV